MSKRVHVTLPDAVYDALERWADSQGRPVANLAAFIIETAVKGANNDGEIPPPPSSPAKN